METLNDKEKAELTSLFSSVLEDNTFKIERAKQLFKSSGSAEATQEAIKKYKIDTAKPIPTKL